MKTIDQRPLFTEVNKEESATVRGGIKADFNEEKQTVTVTLDNGKKFTYYYGSPGLGLPFGSLSGFFSYPAYGE
jgi:hypothetical protein